MINLEQVRLLETKVAKTIDYIERLTGDNSALQQQETELRAKLGSYQKRIDELEVLITRFKEDQNQIEDTFFATLDRLSKFEDAMEKCLVGGKAKPGSKEPAQAAPKTGSLANAAQAVKTSKAAAVKTAAEQTGDAVPVDAKISFEIPEDDVTDPLTDSLDDEFAANAGGKPDDDGELDIF